MRRSRGRRPRGVTLVEVAVALVVLSVGWAALLGLQQLALRTLTEAGVREVARWTLQSVADSLDRRGPPSTGRSQQDWGWVEWHPDGGGVWLEAWTLRDGSVAGLWSTGGGP